jgi:oligopeptide transport system ATP-binding protein
MRDVRGRDIAMIFQEPMTSLNPVTTIGAQIVEGITRHLRLGRRAARTRAAELLALVGIPDPTRRLDSYPHQLSGGMRQRAMIAMALSCDPSILIADEPTTALDVTIQAQILDLLARLQQQTGMSMIFITHNLGVVAEIADRVLVMYGGRLVEEAEVHPLFAQPLMPYTIGLLNSVPRLDFSGTAKVGLQAIPGSVPDPHAMPHGCGFAPRCGYRLALCDADIPALEQVAEARQVRCARWREIAA